MTFIKYTNDGKAVIQPAALTLSNLDNEDMLEMHTLDNAIVLLKEDMAPMEKYLTIASLIRLVESLAVELESNTDDGSVNYGDEDDDVTGDTCDDVIPIPAEAFEDAGIWGKDLHIQAVDGAVVITADEEGDESTEKMVQTIGKHLFDAAVSLNIVNQLLASGGANA